MSIPPVEPSADMRVLARNLRQMYVALVAEEFTTDEALGLIAIVLRGSNS